MNRSENNRKTLEVVVIIMILVAVMYVTGNVMGCPVIRITMIGTATPVHVP